EVGVDVEWIRELHDAEELVSRFFSPRESRVFHELPSEIRPAAFFNLWTRKEAWLKATGEGIGYLLDRVEVSFLPWEPGRLLRLPGWEDGASWSLLDLKTARGFAAALAIAKPRVEVVHRSLL